MVLKTVPLPRRPRFFTPCTPLCSAPSPWSALVFCGKPHVEQVSIARSVLFRNQTGKPERIMARLRYPVRGQPLVVVRPEIRFGTIATRDNVSSIIETFIPSPIQNCTSTYWLLLFVQLKKFAPSPCPELFSGVEPESKRAKNSWLVWWGQAAAAARERVGQKVEWRESE